MPNQKINTPNSILDVKQYIFCDSNDGFNKIASKR